MLCVQKSHLNFIENSLELHLIFSESILEIGGLCNILVRFIRSSNKANILHSTWLNPHVFVGPLISLLIHKKLKLKGDELCSKISELFLNY